MRLPGLRDKDVDALRRTFRHFSCVREVRVFGSRARGIARRSSDLDLAISSPEATPTEWAEPPFVPPSPMSEQFSRPFAESI